jgi:hypothetical protein
VTACAAYQDKYLDVNCGGWLQSKSDAGVTFEVLDKKGVRHRNLDFALVPPGQVNRNSAELLRFILGDTRFHRIPENSELWEKWCIFMAGMIFFGVRSICVSFVSECFTS